MAFNHGAPRGERAERRRLSARRKASAKARSGAGSGVWRTRPRPATAAERRSSSCPPRSRRRGTWNWSSAPASCCGCVGRRADPGGGAAHLAVRGADRHAALVHVRRQPAGRFLTYQSGYRRSHLTRRYPVQVQPRNRRIDACAAAHVRAPAQSGTVPPSPTGLRAFGTRTSTAPIRSESAVPEDDRYAPPGADRLATSLPRTPTDTARTPPTTAAAPSAKKVRERIGNRRWVLFLCLFRQESLEFSRLPADGITRHTTGFDGHGQHGRKLAFGHRTPSSCGRHRVTRRAGA